ncbi:hypothetical protein CsSME_00020341 [Camellia sinensis var. sinensis]
MEDAQGESSSSSQPQEMVVPEVDQKLLEELEGMGFPKARAIRALHYSGNTSLEAAVNWVVEHENDADIDELPKVCFSSDIVFFLKKFFRYILLCVSVCFFLIKRFWGLMEGL